MIQVTGLSEKDLREIGRAYANYVYPDDDRGMFPFDDKEMLTRYIVGFARSCMQAGMLYTTSEKHEGYIAITTPDTKYPLKSVVTFIREVIGSLGWKRYFWFVKYIARGGENLETKVRKQKRRYVVVQLLAIPEKYQDVSSVTATAAHVLDGDKFVDATGTVVTGTMANNGAVSKTMDGLTTTSVTIEAGYTSGGTVSLTNDIETALAAI